MISLHPARASDGPAIDHLLDACFGPARRNRTAYRLRDGVAPCAAASLVARDDNTLVGSIQLWPIELRAPDGRVAPVMLLGPLAVSPGHRDRGIGSRLMRAALGRVDAAGGGPVVLIGDAPYYERFGFTAAPTTGWSVPGPVDRARLLVRGGGSLPAVATLGPPRVLATLAA